MKFQQICGSIFQIFRDVLNGVLVLRRFLKINENNNCDRLNFCSSNKSGFDNKVDIVIQMIVVYWMLYFSEVLKP